MCPECGGRGTVRQPETITGRSGVGGDNLHGGYVLIRGWRVPCPRCKGKKTCGAVDGNVPGGGRCEDH